MSWMLISIVVVLMIMADLLGEQVSMRDSLLS